MEKKSYDVDKEFYVVLPSDGDAANIYPENKSSSFKIPLATPINVENDNWYVGLSEIYVPNYFFNITDDMRFYTFKTSRDNAKIIKIPKGYYTPDTWVTTINKVLDRQFSEFQARFHHENIAKNIALCGMKYGEEFIVKDERMAYMLGMRFHNVVSEESPIIDLQENHKTLYIPPIFERVAKIAHQDQTKSEELKTLVFEDPCYFTKYTQFMFVYTDIIEYSHIGDMKAPILRIINIMPSETERNIDILHRVYPNPAYHKIKADSIKDIEIHLANNYGEEMKLETGVSVIILHFKKEIAAVS